MVGLQPTGPSRCPSLPDAVRRHAPGLHRTAVMLAGSAEEADRLVAEAFRHAGEVWGRARPSSGAGAGARTGRGQQDVETRPVHDRLLHELVRAYLRHAVSRHRDDLAPTDGGQDSDAGDVLASLRPRARAAAVLTHVEGWPPGRTAGTLHVRQGRVTALVPPSGALRTALEAVADQQSRPAQDVVATVLAALPAAVDRPGTAVLRPGSASPAGRPWTWRVLAAALALGLVVWVSVLTGTGGQDPSATADADTGTTMALVDGTSLPTAGGDLAERGWVLDAAGRPPVDLEGLRLLEAVPIDLGRATAPLRVDTEPRSGSAVFAVLWCDIPAVDANLELPAARLGIGGESATIPCAGMAGEPPVERLVPLPPATGRGLTTALVSWSGDVPGRGRALLATYTEVGAGPFVRGTDRAPAPAAGPGSVVLDGSGPAYQVRDRPVHHQRVRIGSDSTITVWAGAVGEITVQVDDVVLTDDGDTPGGPVGTEPARSGDGSGAVGAGPGAVGDGEAPGAGAGHGEDGTCESEGGGTGAGATAPIAWRAADPELRDGRWLVYRPGRARSFALPDEVRPGTGERRVVTVAVTTTLDQRSWQVHLGDAEVVQEDRTPQPLLDLDASVGAPLWIGGHRLVAAWRVPNDGVPHPLVDPGLRPGRRFLLVGTPPGTELGTWGVVEPHVATTRGAADLTVVGEVADAFDESVWHPGDQLVRTGASTANILAGSGTGVLGATAPASAGGTPPSTLLAYQPVLHGDFDFAAAPPMGVSVAAPAVAGGAVAGASAPDAVVVGRWTLQDLDDEGLLTIDADLTGRTWLRLSTAGEGRVQVLEGGRPAVWLPDGWWSSWTAQPVVTEVRVVGTRRAGIPGQPFQLRVEGYEGLTVEVLARDSTDSTDGIDGTDSPDGVAGRPAPPETLGR